MDLLLKNKVAMITGGTKGIGAGIAEVLASEGVHLILLYRSDTEYAVKFSERLEKEYNVRVLGLQVDVTKKEQVEEAFKKSREKFHSLDILINNAASSCSEDMSFEELTYDDWQTCMNGCLLPVFLMSKYFVSECKRNLCGGHIINLSAKVAFYSKSKNKVPYATAKGAIATMTKRMANDLIEHGIYVNAIVPGYVLSNFYKDTQDPKCKAKEKDLKIGWAVPEDMGNIVAFLCSEKSKQIIGACIDCSGGTML